MNSRSSWKIKDTNSEDSELQSHEKIEINELVGAIVRLMSNVEQNQSCKIFSIFIIGMINKENLKLGNGDSLKVSKMS